MEEPKESRDAQQSSAAEQQLPTTTVEDATPTQQDSTVVVESEAARSEEKDAILAQNPSADNVSKANGNNDTRPSKPVNVPLIILVIIVTALFTSAVICGAILLVQGNATPPDSDVPAEPVSDTEPASIDSFGFEFLKLEEEGKNIIYSPLSIKYALAMLSDAAAGESKSQIENLVGDVSVAKYINNDKQSLANAMFVRDEKLDQINDAYIQTLEQKYNASVIPEPFTSEVPLNNWVSDKTFGLINNLLDSSIVESDFVLINALAIDMNWNNKLQCISTEKDDQIPCMHYDSYFAHENYSDSVRIIGLQGGDEFDTVDFNGRETPVAKVAASANKYDIISDLGEDYIRSTVQSAYDEWLAKAQEDEKYPTDYNIEFDIDTYMDQLKSNYGKIGSSTDFYLLDTDTEKVFAKDLQENDGSTLQYIGIMPKNENLSTYIDNITSEKITNISKNLNNVATIDGFKEGVITKVTANIPFFDFDYQLQLKDDLQTLGITDVFNREEADLSQMTSVPKSYIQNALHKADIEFSNDGIRAAAATALPGGLGAGGDNRFEYSWDVPVEEIDLTFDQPFLFVVRDKTTGEVWFTGAVYTPTEK